MERHSGLKIHHDRNAMGSNPITCIKLDWQSQVDCSGLENRTPLKRSEGSNPSSSVFAPIV